MDFLKIFTNITHGFSFDLGVDLGTANTVIYMKKKGIIAREPSLVAVNKKTKRIVALGENARNMLGKTPAHIEVLRPLQDGVIHDFEITQELLHHFFKLAETHITSWFQINPRVVIGVPLNITNVELQSLFDAAKYAGAKEVYIIEEPLSSLLGAGFSIKEPRGRAIIDIGGGTTDIAVVSLGNVVVGKSITIAGDTFNIAIQTFLRQNFKILVGIKTAEETKINYGLINNKNEDTLEVRGKDVSSGLPHVVYVSEDDIYEALFPLINEIVIEVKKILEKTPEELISDIIEDGLVLTGGGSLLRGLKDVLQRELNIPIVVPEEPLLTVVEGIGVILDSLDEYKDILSQTEYDFTKKYTK